MGFAPFVLKRARHSIPLRVCQLRAVIANPLCPTTSQSPLRPNAPVVLEVAIATCAFDLRRPGTSPPTRKVKRRVGSVLLDRSASLYASLPVAFMPHGVIDEPEGRYLRLERLPHRRQRPLHVPSWMNPLPHLAAPDLGLGASMSLKAGPISRKGDPLTRRPVPLTPYGCAPSPERCRRPRDGTLLLAEGHAHVGSWVDPSSRWVFPMTKKIRP